MASTPAPASFDEHRKKRLSIGRGLFSPTRKTLDLNDDEAEKEELRRMKEDQARRKTMDRRQSMHPQRDASSSSSSSSSAPAPLFPSLSRERSSPNLQLSNPQLSDLYEQCIHLASANKINQKNAWSLRLIDHIGDVLGNQASGSEMNFQRASCTLDASVMIYSSRVDSVHKETFKVLGGLSRSDADKKKDKEGDEGESGDEGEDNGADGDNKAKKKRARKAHSTTLETRPIQLNVKRIEMEVEVDPLFQKTTAAFDEGGAKGLLLNNLSVYGGCNIAFDSSDAYQDEDEEDVEQVQRDKAIQAMNLDLSDLWATVEENAKCVGGLRYVSRLPLCPELGRFRGLAQRAQDHTDSPSHDEKLSLDDNDDDDDNDWGISGEGDNGIDMQAFDEAIAQEQKIFQEIQEFSGVDGGDMDDGFSSPVHAPIDVAGIPAMSLAHLGPSSSSSASSSSSSSASSLPFGGGVWGSTGSAGNQGSMMLWAGQHEQGGGLLGNLWERQMNKGGMAWAGVSHW